MHSLVPDWPIISAELWSRAARFSHAVGSTDRQASPPSKSGFFFFSDLDWIDQPQPHVDAWWWIYVPLLRRLLGDRHDSMAYLVGLGHHVRGAPDTEPKREWVHFLPADFQETANRDALNHLLLMASYNASLPTHAEGKVPLLLSTALLEHFNTPKEMREGEITALVPLLLDFAVPHASTPTQGPEFPTVLAPWAALRQAIVALDPNALLRAQVTEQARQLCNKHVTDAFDLTEIDNTSLRLPCLSPSAIPRSFRDLYRRSIGHRRELLLRSADLSNTLFMAVDDRQLVGYWLARWKKYGQESKRANLIAELLNYSLWLHDLTLHGDKDFTQILTALSWLPSQRAWQRWSSIVIYLRPPLANSIGNTVVPQIVASFAAASGFTSAESAADQEREKRNERDELIEYLKKQTEKSLLVRRGRNTWGAVFGGEWFVFPDNLYWGWHYLAQLIDRANNGLEPLTAFDLALSRKPLIGMPLIREETTDSDNPSLKTAEGRSQSEHGATGRVTGGVTQRDSDDPFIIWTAGIVDGFINDNGRLPANELDAGRVVEEWLLTEAHGADRCQEVVLMCKALLEAAVTDSAKVTSDKMLEQLVRECGLVKSALRWNWNDDDDLQVQTRQAWSRTSERGDVVSKLVPAARSAIAYLQACDDREAQNTKPKARLGPEQKQALAACQAVRRCIGYLQKLDDRSPKVRTRNTESLYPNEPANLKAARALGEHLRVITTKCSTGTVRLGRNCCQYLGSIIAVDEPAET